MPSHRSGRTRPVNVLFAIGSLQPGGSEHQLVALLENLPESIDPILLTFAPTGANVLARRVHRLGITSVTLEQVERSRWSQPFYYAVTLTRILRILHQVRPAAVYAWLDEAGAWLAPLAKVLGIPCIVARRNLVGSTLERRWRAAAWIIRRAERMAVLITANSSAVADDAIARGIRPDQIRLVRNGHVIDQPDQPALLGDNELVVLGYLAHFREEKGHKRLIEVLDGLESARPWRVVLGGTGELEHEVREDARSRGLLGRLTFMGFVTDARAFWAQCHIAVLLSDSEGSPNALIEAALMGRPIIATAVGGTPEVVAPDGGVLVNPDDVSEARRELRLLIEDSDRRLVLGRRAYAQACSRFAIDQSVSGHLAAIHECVL